MKNQANIENLSTLVADIGGTNARFAIVAPGSTDLLDLIEFPCKEFENIDVALKEYLDGLRGIRPDRVCLAVPGPVEKDAIRLVNSHWYFSQQKLASFLNLPLYCINDFDAQAYYVRSVEDRELLWLDSNRCSSSLKGNAGAKLVVGAGTGLGVSAILPSGELVQSEGGHMAFAPLNHHQSKILDILRTRFPRVSVERLLSGPGLENLYWANAELVGSKKEISAKEIVEAMEKGDSVALSCVDDFFEILAAVSGDLVLAMGAWSGVYISGGVTPRLLKYLDKKKFRLSFSDKGRFKQICQETPIAFVMADQPGLKGCSMADWKNNAASDQDGY